MCHRLRRLSTAGQTKQTKESQRDSATKPRVARDELPWVKVAVVSQPQRPTGLWPRCAALQWAATLFKFASRRLVLLGDYHPPAKNKPKSFLKKILAKSSRFEVNHFPFRNPSRICNN